MLFCPGKKKKELIAGRARDICRAYVTHFKKVSSGADWIPPLKVNVRDICFTAKKSEMDKEVDEKEEGEKEEKKDTQERHSA